MKILFFCRRFWPLIGGVEKHVLEISKRLIEKGNKITVVTEWSKGDGRFKGFGKYEGIKIYRIPITTNEKLKKFQIWKWLWENRILIKEADIIHCHDVFYWFLPFKFLYPRKKVFTTFHGYEGSQPPKWNKILSHKMAGWLSNGSIAIGDFHQKWYGIKSEIVSYGAVENLERVMEVENEVKYDFCFVGRLAHDTGIMIYLEALKVLKERGEAYCLVICGDGPQMSEAVEFSKKNKLDAVFKGFVDDVEKYINNSKFIFVSRYLGILEALLAKKLIYAVYESEIKKDYLKLAPFASWIIIEKDAVALANKISYFENRPGKSTNNIQKGFNWAKQQTWDKLTDKYFELWGKSKFH